MSKLEEILPILYKDMHAAGLFLGDTWRAHADRFRQFVHPRPPGLIVDFGCGPKGGLVADPYLGPTVVPYDPHVKAYAAPPWGAGPWAVFSSDVLEHLPVSQLRAFVRTLCKQRTISHVFLALSTRAANKTMPNGMNAHLTVRPAAWWQGFFEFTLGEHFDATIAEADVLADTAVFGFVRRPETP